MRFPRILEQKKKKKDLKISRIFQNNFGIISVKFEGKIYNVHAYTFVFQEISARNIEYAKIGKRRTFDPFSESKLGAESPSDEPAALVRRSRTISRR